MSHGIKLYKSYSFKDKDPIIDRMRTIFHDEGATYSAVSDDSGVAAGTFRNWFAGETMRPQYATITATLRALGYDFRIVKTNDHAMKKSAEIIDIRKRKAG